MISATELSEILEYDRHTGLFKWVTSPNFKIKIGDVAGSLHKYSGYIQLRVNKKLYPAHRLVWLYVYGEYPILQIDHINGVRDDNRVENLRCVTPAENAMNKCVYKQNKLGVTGVYYDKRINKYCAYIKVNKIQHHLGVFESLEDAKYSRLTAEKQYFGKFSRNIS